jgi:hypothetical protein
VRAGRDRHGPGNADGTADTQRGWSVVFADGFGGSSLVDRVFTARTATTGDAEWLFTGTSGDRDGFNDNEIQKFNPGQISQQSDGLHITAAYSRTAA